MMTPWQALVAAIALVVAVGALGRLVFMRVGDLRLPEGEGDQPCPVSVRTT